MGGPKPRKSEAPKGGALVMADFGQTDFGQYYSDVSGIIVYFRALQGHSGRNLVDPSLQDNVMIESGIFHYIYHVGCAFNSFYYQQWINTWRSRFEQKTDSVLLAC